eukprot:m.548698 g.548698  ORF g.548698 m.548698 type:complete len:310 (-) comp57718_c0_seq2:2118-3047(-)
MTQLEATKLERDEQATRALKATSLSQRLEAQVTQLVNDLQEEAERSEQSSRTLRRKLTELAQERESDAQANPLEFPDPVGARPHAESTQSFQPPSTQQPEIEPVRQQPHTEPAASPSRNTNSFSPPLSPPAGAPSRKSPSKGTRPAVDLHSSTERAPKNPTASARPRIVRIRSTAVASNASSPMPTAAIQPLSSSDVLAQIKDLEAIHALFKDVERKQLVTLARDELSPIFAENRRLLNSIPSLKPPPTVCEVPITHLKKFVEFYDKIAQISPQHAKLWGPYCESADRLRALIPGSVAKQDLDEFLTDV